MGGNDEYMGRAVSRTSRLSKHEKTVPSCSSFEHESATQQVMPWMNDFSLQMHLASIGLQLDGSDLVAQFRCMVKLWLARSPRLRNQAARWA